MECRVCNVGVPKYKCPSCRIPYCSLPCWKTHKADGCQKEPKCPVSAVNTAVSSTTPKPTYYFPTDDTVPPEKLKRLGDNEQLKAILSNPHVRTILSSLDQASNPSHLLREAMQEPIFLEFVDECMKTLDPPKEMDLEEAINEQLLES